MFHQADLRLLTLAGIAHRCAQETDLFFQRQAYDPRYCFELFRRAIVERVERAWELVYVQYRPLVLSWVERHAAFPTSSEEAQYFVNRAFEKMWVALTPDKFDRFPNLKSLLRYLQMCVHSVILDLSRVTERPTVDIEVEVLAAESKVEGSIVENLALDLVRRQEFWHEVNARLHGEKEQRVVYGTFILGLKPRELCVQFRDTFRDIAEVYRVKENVLDRLRRDSELERLFDENI